MVFQTVVVAVVYVTVVVVVVIASSVVLTTAGTIPGRAATTAAIPTMLRHVGRIPVVDSELAAEGRPRRGRPSAQGS